MFRPMRRIRQQLSDRECEEILRTASSGVLALYGENGYPYAVPLSPAYEEGKLYFHCAREGHKLDAIRQDGHASFCVIAQDDVRPKERTTAFISVIAFGKVRIVEDETELRHIARLLGEKFSPGFEADCEQETEETLRTGRLRGIEMTIEHLTGKCGREVLMERNQR